MSSSTPSLEGLFPWSWRNCVPRWRCGSRALCWIQGRIRCGFYSQNLIGCDAMTDVYKFRPFWELKSSRRFPSSFSETRLIRPMQRRRMIWGPILDSSKRLARVKSHWMEPDLLSFSCALLSCVKDTVKVFSHLTLSTRSLFLTWI